MVRPSALKPCAWPARAAPRWRPRARQQRQIALPGAEGGLASLAHRPPWSGRSAGPARGQQTAGPRTGGVKKSHRYFFCHPDPVSQLPFIGQQRLHYPVQLLCHVLSVVAGRYYARCQRATIRPAIKGKPAWETAMVDIFDHRRYGTSRPQVGLREPGYRVGRQALRTACAATAAEPGSPGLAPRTTDSTHRQRCAPNLLLDQPRPTQANRVWVSGISCLPLPASGSTAAPSKTRASSRSWASRCGRICPEP